MALSAPCAQAAPALATNNVNMRQGPGTTYPVIITIPGGSTVEVSGREWRSVSWHGQSGYVIATSLDQDGGAPPPGAGGPPSGASAGGPYPPGAPPGYRPPGDPPPGYYYPPGYAPYYFPGPYYYGPYYRPYWYRRWW